jgi:hypothetical protein
MHKVILQNGIWVRNKSILEINDLYSISVDRISVIQTILANW